MRSPHIRHKHELHPGSGGRQIAWTGYNPSGTLLHYHMPIALTISPHGRLLVEESADESLGSPDPAATKRITAAFAESPSRGLLDLATTELQAVLPPSFAFARDRKSVV